MYLEERNTKDTYSATDRELVNMLILNNQEAFCELYARYKDRLLYFTINFIKSAEYAEDVYQDAFIAIWQSRHFLDPEKSFSSYLYTIVKNRILNILRDIEHYQKLKSYIVANSIDYIENTEEHVSINELKAILDKALVKLTPRQREIFELSRSEHKTHREIAEILGISVFTVQEHLSLALKSIKLYIKKYPEYMVNLLILIISINI